MSEILDFQSLVSMKLRDSGILASCVILVYFMLKMGEAALQLFQQLNKFLVKNMKTSICKQATIF